MQAFPPKANRPICFALFRAGFARRSSIAFSILWLAFSLLTMVQLAGCGIAYNTLPLSVSPNSVSFGTVQVGKSQTTTVTLQNQGLTAVTLSGMQVADPAFALSSDQANTTIPAGGSTSLKVSFAPTAAKDYSSQVVIQSGGQKSAIAVSGTGQQQQSTPPPAPGSPAMQVSSTTLEFGSVPIGGNAQQTVTVTSTGTAPLDINALSATGTGFSTSTPALPLSLQPGQSLTIPVTFGPKNAGAESGQLVIGSDAVGSTSVAVNLVGSGATSTPAPPNTPALTLSSTAVDFGSVAAGSQSSNSVTLTSSGTEAVVIQSLAVSGNAFSTGKVQVPLTLAPGQQIVLPLTFAPSAAGAQKGEVTLTDNATGSPNAISLTGTGTTSAPAPPNTPALTLSSTAVDFGSVAAGSQSSNSVTLTSSGTAAVVIQSLAVSGDAFSAGTIQLPLILAPGQQVALPLTFAPSAGGAQKGDVTLTDNATGSPNSISLTGTGTTSASLSVPASVDFGDVTVGSSGSKTVTLVANGSAAVTINSIAVAGGSFSGPPMTLPQVLQPNQQMALKVKFSPAAEGDATGSITVSSNSTTNASAKIPMHGKGIATTAPSLSASATSLSFGQVAVGSESAKSLTVTSTGTAPATISGGSVTGAGYTATYAGVPISNLSAPLTLQPGQRVTFDVVFDPSKAGASNGQLSLATDTGSPVNVSLSGKGTNNTSPALTLSDSSLNFGDVQMGSAAVEQLTLTSSGTAPVTISSAAIAGQNFQITSVQYPSGTTGWPATLNPGQQVVLSITFSPDAAASFNGNLALTSDASGGAANVPLSGTGDAVPAADLTLSTTSINFGQVQIGSKVTRSLTLTSTGNAPLTISAITVAGAQFSDGSPSLPVTLQPQQQLTLTLTYQPTAEGSDSGTLTVASNDSSGPATVSLGGSGTTAASPQLTVNPTAVDFGSVPLNTPGNKTVTLTSSGTAAVTITAANVTGSSFSVSGASFPLTLNPNQTATLQVQFDPSAAGTASGQLSITSDATGGTAMIPLSGTGAVTTSAQLTVSTNSLSFGNVAVNSSATLPVTLTSSGTAPVTISAAALSGASFTDSGATFPVTLNPTQSVTLNVQFKPTATGQAAGQLTITSNSSTGASSVVQLSGTGTTTATAQLQVGATSLAFGNVPVNSTATLPLTLTSSGTAPVTVSSAALSGTGFSDSGVSIPVTLNPGQSVTLNVQFDPTTAGAVTGRLTISSNSSTGATIQVQLTGTGAAAQHEIDLTWQAPASSPDPVAGYNIYRSTGSGGSFTMLNGSPESQASYTDSSVQSGTIYVYEVKSVDANGVESSASNQITLSVP